MIAAELLNKSAIATTESNFLNILCLILFRFDLKFQDQLLKGRDPN